MMTTAISSNLPVFVVIAPFIVAFIPHTSQAMASREPYISIKYIVGSRSRALTHYVKAQDTVTS